MSDAQAPKHGAQLWRCDARGATSPNFGDAPVYLVEIEPLPPAGL